MPEEDRRQVILAALHGHYRGKATAEAFNVEGKTDLLIKHEGQNLFIGECKIWNGVQTFTDAVDQLFTYTAWRDTKLAVVMFVSTRDLTAVIERAKEGLAEHAQFVSWKDAGSETELRATLHWPGDQRRLADLNAFFIHCDRELRAVAALGSPPMMPGLTQALAAARPRSSLVTSRSPEPGPRLTVTPSTQDGGRCPTLWTLTRRRCAAD